MLNSSSSSEYALIISQLFPAISVTHTNPITHVEETFNIGQYQYDTGTFETTGNIFWSLGTVLLFYDPMGIARRIWICKNEISFGSFLKMSIESKEPATEFNSNSEYATQEDVNEGVESANNYTDTEIENVTSPMTNSYSPPESLFCLVNDQRMINTPGSYNYQWSGYRRIANGTKMAISTVINLKLLSGTIPDYITGDEVTITIDTKEDYQYGYYNEPGQTFILKYTVTRDELINGISLPVKVIFPDTTDEKLTTLQIGAKYTINIETLNTYVTIGSALGAYQNGDFVWDLHSTRGYVYLAISNQFEVELCRFEVKAENNVVEEVTDAGKEYGVYYNGKEPDVLTGSTYTALHRDSALGGAIPSVSNKNSQYGGEYCLRLAGSGNS